VPGDVRILAVSSGADRATFGDGYAKQLTLSGDVDGVGLGTYTASVLFQVAPKAHVTAVDVYRKGRVDRAAVGDALQWARDHARDLDAVVLAFPPASLLDPMAAGLAGGETRTVGTDAAASASERTAAALAGGWAKLRDNVAELGRAGIAVVAPAGDLGPAPQSVLGVAGLPEVVTVGAADRDGVARASAGGPSVFGRVKPDLVAPAGIAGLVPDESSLAGLLDLGGPAAGPAPVLDLPVPAAGGRAALVGSTIPAAAAVTAIAAQLHHDGVAGAADLGTEPAAGHPWAADLDILGGTAGPASFDLTERITTAASGKREALTAAAGEPRPVPAVSAAVRPAPRPAAAAPAEKPGPAAATDGLHLTLPPGDNPWAPGAWCGYLHLPLTGLGTSVVEDVPLCLVEGLSLTAFNFFIHDMPAEDLTFALLPALPPGLGLLDGPLMVLPLDP